MLSSRYMLDSEFTQVGWVEHDPTQPS